MKTMKSNLNLRQQSQAIFAIFIVLAVVDTLLFWLIGEVIGGILLAAVVGVPFLLTAKLRCRCCDTRLTELFNPGSLLLLFLAKEKCPKCGCDLP